MLTDYPSIPVLTGQAATDFVVRAEKNARRKSKKLTKKDLEILRKVEEASKNFKFKD